MPLINWRMLRITTCGASSRESLVHDMKFSMLREKVDELSPANVRAYAPIDSPGRFPGATLLRGWPRNI